MNAALHQETYLPEHGEDAQIAEIYDLLNARERAGLAAPESAYFLSGTSPGERVELPEELYRILRQVVEALRNGLAVTVAPHSMTLTTQQAAELLGVSRPTVIRLLDNGQIPYERTGSHRRVTLQDVLEYRKRRREAQYAALAATAAEEEEDVSTAIARAREARKAVAKRRNARRTSR